MNIKELPVACVTSRLTQKMLKDGFDIYFDGEGHISFQGFEGSKYFGRYEGGTMDETIKRVHEDMAWLRMYL